MRTIRLREHQPQIVRLSGDELQDLLALVPRLIEISRQKDGLYKLKAKSRVGTAVLGSIRLLIRPKVGLPNVFFLLGYTNNIRWGGGDFPYEEDDLFKAVAWWFDREVARASRYGPSRAYVDREETLTTIRGRIALDRQLAARPGRRFPIECRFQEYSEDTPLNRLLKAAHVALLRLPQLDREAAVRFRHRTRQFFGAVETAEYSLATLPVIAFNRLNRHWESAARLARLILQQRSIRDEDGKIVGTTFTIDMNQLFERFIETVVEERVRDTSYTLETQARRRLTSAGRSLSNVVVPAINMRPDLVLKAGNTAVAVGDAKYKELLRIGDWEHPDIYQLIAYCVRLELREGLLIYAGDRPLTQSTIIGSQITLSTIGVDLSGFPQAVLQQARRGADALIAIAARHSASVAA